MKLKLALSCCNTQVLLTKAKIEAEDAQRLLFGSLNGLAALMLLDTRPADAVALYRQVGAAIFHSSNLLLHWPA